MSILFPTDIASIVVILVLFGVVGYGLRKLLAARKTVRRERKAIERLTRDELLEDLQSTRKRASEFAEIDEVLVERGGVSSSSVVLEHVRALARAGFDGSRIEVQQRLSITVDEIFRDNARIKAVLSVFIVIGLLGTLYGLAEALATLSANDLLNFEPAVVSTLLGRLKTALAPSIWGVGFTIAGVMYYGHYLNAECQPVKGKLEKATLHEWVPTLNPTKSQRTTETLEEARRQLRDNMEAAERVAEFAERVDADLESFDERMHSASGLLKDFTGTLQTLDETAASFDASMQQMGGFHEKLAAVYERVEDRQERLNVLLSELETRDEAFGKSLQSIESLQQAWKDHLYSTQDELKSVATAARDALEQVQAQNEAIATSLREPIVREMENVTTALSHVDESLHVGLQEIDGSLKRIEQPVGASAERIERIADTFTDSLYNTVSGVKEEFERRNDEQLAYKDELDRLNSNLEALLEVQRASQHGGNGAASSDDSAISKIKNLFST